MIKKMNSVLINRVWNTSETDKLRFPTKSQKLQGWCLRELPWNMSCQKAEDLRWRPGGAPAFQRRGEEKDKKKLAKEKGPV